MPRRYLEPPEPGPDTGNSYVEDANAFGHLIRSALGAPRARLALSEADHAERIVMHMRRAAWARVTGLDTGPDRATCWGCCKPAGKDSGVTDLGWYSGPFYSSWASHLKELYCPACRKMLGGKYAPRDSSFFLPKKLDSRTLKRRATA